MQGLDFNVNSILKSCPALLELTTTSMQEQLTYNSGHFVMIRRLEVTEQDQIRPTCSKKTYSLTSVIDWEASSRSSLHPFSTPSRMASLLRKSRISRLSFKSRCWRFCEVRWGTQLKRNFYHNLEKINDRYKYYYSYYCVLIINIIVYNT